MSQLPQILAEFRAGKLDQSRLLARIEELLEPNGSNLDALLAAIQGEHTKSPLPLGTLVALRKHLLAAAAPKTEILSAPAPSQPPTPPKPSQPPVTANSSEDAAAKQAIGATLAGRFKLVEFIGAGGTSRLYKAIDQRKVEAGSDDPHIAVKVLTYPFKNTNEALSVLNRETEGTQKLTHPNIVRVIDCDRDGDTVFMTMEFIGGKTLHALLRTSRFVGSGRAEALAIIRDVADAIDFAHSKFVVHGDLTPGNIMIGISGGAKVIDFGIARIFGQSRTSTAPTSGTGSSSRGEMAGYSPSYASPETIDQLEPDPRDDIYSLACIAWELLTGTHPFGRKNAKAARDAGLKPEYSDKLSRAEYAALTHALEFDRAKRTASAKEFIAELTATKKKSTAPLAIAAALIVAVTAGAAFYFSRTPTTPVAAVQPQRAPAPPPKVVEPPSAATPLAAGSVFRDCPTCPLMTVVPSGDYLQGSPTGAANAESFEMPQHRVSIAQSFAASRTEITVGEYGEFVQATGRTSTGCSLYDGAWKVQPDAQWKNAIPQQTPSHPVSCVSWQDAGDYVKWLSSRTGQTYRLPSASEWEYAARAGSTGESAWSQDSDACAAANVADQSAAQRYPGWTVVGCNDAHPQSAPAGLFNANAFGLYDMLGNVFEWGADCWSDDYVGAPDDGRARRDGDCSQHEMRGGSWFTAPRFVRFAYRNRFASDYRSSSVGFRVVREITQ